MRKILILSVLLTMAATAFGGRLVRIPMATDSDFLEIQSMGYDITSGSRSQGFVDIMVQERFLEGTLQRYPEARLLPIEWSQLLPRDDRDEYGYYHGPNENNAFWATLAENSDMVDTPASYGTSYEGRDLYYVRITNAGPGAPAILFTSLMHAREPGGNSAVIDFAQWLTTEYGSDTMATFILDNAQVYFIPMMNPDGYIENAPGGGMHRKNMNYSVPVPSSGIDLNRNYSIGWGYDDYGSSPDPYDETYRGSAPQSEPETYLFTAFFDTIDPVGGMMYHTYGGYLLYPYAYNNSPTPDEETFQSWAAQMTEQNDYDYGRCGDVLGYPANGDAIDWAYGEHTKIFFTPEVADNGFWGCQNNQSLLETNNLECRYMNKLLCMNLLSMTGVSAETSAGIQGEGLSVSIGSNPVTSALSYTVAGSQSASVTILDVAGRTVAAPSDGYWAVPDHLVNGVYFLRAENGNHSATERFTVLR